MTTFTPLTGNFASSTRILRSTSSRRTVSCTTASTGSRPTCSISPSASYTCWSLTCVTMSPARNPNRSAGALLHEHHPRSAGASENFTVAEVFQPHTHVAIFDFATLLERIDDAAKRRIDGHRIARRLLGAGRSGHRRGEADHFAVQIDQRPAAGPQIQLGIGLNQRAEMIELDLPGRAGFARLVGGALRAKFEMIPQLALASPSRAMA